MLINYRNNSKHQNFQLYLIDHQVYKFQLVYVYPYHAWYHLLLLFLILFKLYSSVIQKVFTTNLTFSCLSFHLNLFPPCGAFFSIVCDGLTVEQTTATNLPNLVMIASTDVKRVTFPEVKINQRKDNQCLCNPS